MGTTLVIVVMLSMYQRGSMKLVDSASALGSHLRCAVALCMSGLQRCELRASARFYVVASGR